MKLQIELSSKSYSIDLENPIDVSIPVLFNGPQPNTYGVPPAHSKTYEDKNFIGDTRRGGSCNFETCAITPHCNGTHTECAGHISLERISIHNTLRSLLIPSTLITVKPVNSSETSETYSPDKLKDDEIITAKSLFYKLNDAPKEFLKGLLIRTLPNDDSKKERNYKDVNAPFFSLEAMDYLDELGVDHLLVDMPSVDRAMDDGKLSAHHIFWAVPQGSHDVDPEAYSTKTITEMIFVPDEIADGNYLLNIQIPNFVADAAPSRPILYRIH
ncbi:cyclase family protein [bacterium]|nr:cyclase family protein [bacterium]